MQSQVPSTSYVNDFIFTKERAHVSSCSSTCFALQCCQPSLLTLHFSPVIGFLTLVICNLDTEIQNWRGGHLTSIWSHLLNQWKVLATISMICPMLNSTLVNSTLVILDILLPQDPAPLQPL